MQLPNASPDPVTATAPAGDIANRPDRVALISAHIDGLSSALRALNRTIHADPELGYEEHSAHAQFAAFFAGLDGWAVTSYAYGVSSAFVAWHDTGCAGPVGSFEAEYGPCFNVLLLVLSARALHGFFLLLSFLRDRTCVRASELTRLKRQLAPNERLSDRSKCKHRCAN
jgi:hypothetical protein